MGQLSGLDWTVIVVYFAVVFGVALWAALTNRKQRDNSAGYFLAGRNVGWFVIGASLFASNIGSEHLVGLAGAGASTGVVLGQFEVQASLVILVLGWLFVPFYVKSGVFTMPEFLERRYSPAARWYLAVVSIIGYVLTKISVTIYAGGVVFTALMGIEFWTGAIIVVIATGIYTVFGGLRAVLYTDMIQAMVLIGGSIAVAIIGLHEVGGWGVLCEEAGPSMMNMWRPFSDPDFPWTAVLFGAPILGLWYWCTDQFIVQRVLSGKSEEEARRGTIFAGFLKQLPLFIFVIPGVIAFVLAQRGAIELERPDEALPVLIARLLPLGVRGLVVAGLLAALMSSLSSVFNSCSTLITWDIYRKLRPKASEHHLVVVGQISTVILVVLGLAWIPFMRFISGELYTYLQSVQAYIAPPITAVFLLGIFWKRVNAKGALASLLTGFVLGMGRLVAELRKEHLDGWLKVFAEIHFLHFALFLFLLCSGILIVVSLLTRPAPDSQLAGLTFATTEGVELKKVQWSRISLALTLILLAIVAVVWLYFSPLSRF